MLKTGTHQLRAATIGSSYYKAVTCFLFSHYLTTDYFKEVLQDAKVFNWC